MKSTSYKLALIIIILASTALSSCGPTVVVEGDRHGRHYKGAHHRERVQPKTDVIIR